MKLKILLMPAAVVISLILIIWHIYPAWFGEESSSISNTKAEITKIKKEIADIQERKANVQALTQSLDSNAEVEELISKFYPTYRNDEDVVNSINNIAFTEGVFLVNMGVDYKNIKSTDDPARVLAIPYEKENPVAIGSQMNSASDISIPEVDEKGVVLDKKTKLKFIETTLEVYGNYDQIKRFVVSLNRAGLINNIQSFKIYKKENTKTAAVIAENANDDALTVDMVVGFAYYPSSREKASALLSKDLFKSNEFDFVSIEGKRDVLTGNYKKSEVGETGSTNPFLKTAATE